MVKDRVKFSTKRHKKRKGFCAIVESENKLNNVNTSVINFKPSQERAEN